MLNPRVLTAVTVVCFGIGVPAFGGLAHYWTFDADATDSVAGGLDGAFVGSGATITNVVDEYVRGSGGLRISHDTPTGDYVHVEGAVIPTYNPTAFTIATWYKFDETPGLEVTDERNFLWETFPGYTSGVGLGNAGGGRDLEWYFEGTPSTSNTAGPIVNDGQWHHVAIVYDKPFEECRFYHDGLFYNWTVAEPLRQPTDGLNIGNHRAGDGTRNWQGFIDDFAVFHGTLDDNGVWDLYDGTHTPQTVPVIEGPDPPAELPTGRPVAYWTFDNDYTSEVNNDVFEGVPQGGQFTSISNEPGEFIRGTGALKLDSGPIPGGDTTYVDIPLEVADVTRDRQITVSAWYNYTDISLDGSDGRNFVWESAPGYSLAFGLGSAGDAEWWFEGAGSDASGPTITPGEWNHAVMVLDLDAQRAQFFHNGELRDDIPITATSIPAMDGFHIGNHRAADGVRDFDGYIDDVAVYHGVLSPTAVQGLYDGTYTPLTVPVDDGWTPPPQVPTGAPVAYWTFDNDYSSEVNNDFFEGTPQGGQYTSITNEPGEFVRGTGALKLDSGPSSGNQTYVDVPREVADVGRDRQVTVSTWYKFSDISGDGSDPRNFVWESSPDYTLAFGLRDDLGVRDSEWWFRGESSDTSNMAGPEIVPDEWNHAVMVIDLDEERIQFYHNGQLRDDLSPNDSTLRAMAGLHIGNHRAGNGERDWDGFIDDFAVYHGVLSAEAVAGLYDGTHTPLTVPVDDHVAPYPLAEAVEGGWRLTRVVDIDNPNGIALNPVDGNLYVGRRNVVADGGGLYQVTADGTITKLVDSDRTAGVVVDPHNGNVFVSEDYGGSIFRVGFGETGSTPWVSLFGDGDDDDPCGMAIVPDDYTGETFAGLLTPGMILSIDRGSGGMEDLWAWSPDTPDSEVVLISDVDPTDGAGNTIEFDLNFVDPVDVAVSDEQIFVSDAGANKIFEVTFFDTLEELATDTPIESPRSMVFDPLTDDLLVMAGGGQVLRVNPLTGSVDVVIDGLTTQYEFANLAISPDGERLFIADRSADRIYEFTLGAMLLGSIADGNWSSPATWDGGAAIPTTDYAVAVETHTVTVAADGTASSLSINDDGKVAIDSGVTLTVTEDVGVAAGGTLEVASTGKLDAGGKVTFADGSQYVVEIAGSDIGLVAAMDNVSIVTGSRLTFEIDGAAPFEAGPYTLISSFGEREINADGEFLVEGLGGYLPDGGLDYSSIIAVEMTIELNLNPGDANLDTKTDVRDFNLWNANKFTSETDWARGDFNGDGLTDVRDFNQWNAAKFTSATGGGPLVEGQVPEPTALTLLAAAVLALAGYAYRRQRS